MYRQGDVLLKPIDSLPEGLKPIKSLVLIRGEATGHKHQLKKGQIFQDDKSLMFLKLDKASELLHEEHKTIKLPRRFYAVIHQRQYVNKDMVALVQD